MIRLYKEQDYNKLVQFHEKYKNEFELINPGSPNILSSAVIGERETTGFGLIRNLAEVIMLLDKDLNKFKLVKTLEELMTYAEITARIHDHDQIHAFVQDSSFAEILKKHYNFRNTKGEALVKDV